MGGAQKVIMTINAGSSSVKLGLFNDSLARILEATVANIGQANASFTIVKSADDRQTSPAQVANQTETINHILLKISDALSNVELLAIGHRVVHGGPEFSQPVIIDEGVIAKLKSIAHFDPEHALSAIELIESMQRKFSTTPQVACFDTAFYKDMPEVAKLLPLPRKYASLGLRRYGFHGLSYTSLLSSFGESAGVLATNGRLIIAHLGSGASLTAIKDGVPLDTTMSFTPASGVLMSTRSGDLDPGIIEFLNRQTGMSIEQFNHLVHLESGLLGVSELSPDMEQIVNASTQNEAAKAALTLFCYQVHKAIGALASVLNGLDSLIFAGGIGENAPLVRELICENLDYLGIKIDNQRNAESSFLISADDSRVGVHVLATDEAAVIADLTMRSVNAPGEEDQS